MNISRAQFISRETARDKHWTSKLAKAVRSITPQPAFKIPAGQPVYFADVSFYQSTIDWAAYKYPAVVIRAGQNLWTDPQFKRNYSQAKLKGLSRGVYWFYDDRASSKDQADILINLLRNDPPEMEIWIDWERSYSGNPSLSGPVMMMQRVEAAIPGARVGMYTGYYWFRDNADKAHFDYLRAKPLWLAWYTADPSQVSIPEPWDHITLWQYGTPNVGLENGCNTIELDMNIHYLPYSEFKAHYDVTPPPTPDPYTPPEVTHKGTVLVGALNLRSGPSIENTVLGQLSYGDEVFGKPEGDWMHIAKRAGILPYTSDHYCSAKPEYLRLSSLAEGGDEMETYNYGKVEITKGRIFNSEVQIIKVLPGAIADASWVQSKNCLVSQIEGDIVFNCPPYTLSRPNMGLKIDGSVVHDYVPYNPFMYWTADGSLACHHQEKVWNITDTAAQFWRYLIQGGKLNPMVALNPDKYAAVWEALEPRRFLGYDQEGSSYIISVGGNDSSNRGCTLYEGVELGLSLGLIYLIDGDSGQSVQDKVVINGVPENRLWSPSPNAPPIWGVIHLREPLATGPVDPPVPTDPPVERQPVWIKVQIRYDDGSEEVTTLG